MDYDAFFDDVVFDDQALAVLDQAERTYFNENTSPSLQPPPAKRQRTDTGWTFSQSASASGSLPAAETTSIEVDELPEISVRVNDYAFQHFEELREPRSSQGLFHKDTQHRGTRVSDRVPGVHASQNVHDSISTSLGRASHRQSTSSIPPAPPAAAPSSNLPQAATHTQRRPLSRSSSKQTSSQLNRIAIIASALATPAQVGSVPNIPAASPLPPRASLPRITELPASRPLDPDTSDQVASLKERLQELCEQNINLQNALKDAEEARTVKDGEVSVLRRCIERNAQDHASQIAKLKAAKDEADSKQTDMQRHMKDELERLKTQFIFNQHETESNGRKVPMSARSRKQISLSSQTPRFDRTFPNVGPSHMLDSTPVRKTPNLRIQRSPEKTRKSALLPGFENSFLESTPNRPVHLQTNIKPTSPEVMPPPQRLFAEALQHMQPSQEFPGVSSSQILNDDVRMEDDFHQDATVGSELASSPIEERGDFDMEEEEVQPEDGVEIRSFNWRAELTRIILTHTYPSCNMPTIQLLIESTPADHSSTLSQILEIIASTFVDDDYEAVVSLLTRCFASLCIALNLNNLISSLIPCLNLLTTFVNSLPSFLSAFLRSENDERPKILDLICSIIVQHLTAKKHCERAPGLVDEINGFLQALCWNTPEECAEKMACILSSTELLMTLLHTSQPPWFLARITHLLVLMSTHPILARSLLSLSNNQAGDEGQRSGTQKVPQLDRLCSFLIDNARQDTESRVVKSNIIALFSILCLVHADTFAALTSSNAVIPSLVLYLNDASMPIWEDTETLVTSSSLTSSLIRSLNQATHLLHQLVFGTQPVLNLRYKLQCAPHRPFNGITHIFIVAFGRLSYAPPPEWITQEKQDELLLLRELARDLLDLVVDGPEGDSVYAAYQDNEENVDEGDMEEQLLGTQVV